MEQFEITAINSGVRERRSERVTEEVPLTIEVNGREIATLLCSPGDLKDLIAGFLFTSGLANEAPRPEDIVIDTQRWNAAVSVAGGFPEEIVFKRIYTSGCGRGIIFHSPLDIMQRAPLTGGFKIHAEVLTGLMKVFLTSSAEHRETGGVHSAALADSEKILVFRDDIGRHNAFDKVVGAALLRGISLEDKAVLSSGRISSEIFSKALRCRIPVLIAAGSPTNQAVKLARQVNMALAGRTRGSRTIIFSGEERILTICLIGEVE